MPTKPTVNSSQHAQGEVKIPEGWRELKPGTFIRHGDRYWEWNKGPWVEEKMWCTEKYRPADRFLAGDDGRTHWTHIRKIKSPRKSS